MTPKRLSVRFNMDNATDRRAWECLQGAEASKNKTVIAAINAYFERDSDIADIIRQSIRESMVLVRNTLQWVSLFQQVSVNLTPLLQFMKNITIMLFHHAEIVVKCYLNIVQISK